jgi:hypothetical protein
MGLELFANRQLEARVSELNVRDYRALLVVPNRFRDYCSVLVDVADGQMLDVQFADGGRTPPIPQEQLCVGAQRVADEAVETLLL